MLATADPYADFLASKRLRVAPSGFEARDLNPHLFPYQADIVRWGLRLGRAAMFEDTGLGKTIQQLEWSRQVADHTGLRSLILCPPNIAPQTVADGARFGLVAAYCRSRAELDRTSARIILTTYNLFEYFDLRDFGGVAAEESSILKAHDGKTRNAVIDAFQHTPFRSAWTATPAPNDHTEIGNHSEFLGYMTRAEMLATFFVHDGGSTQDWRLKGHARADFWKWVASWAVVMRRPSDIGHPDAGFDLPPLTYFDHTVESDYAAPGLLPGLAASGLHERRAARRASIAGRVAKAIELVASNDRRWLLWCDYNDEQDALAAALGGRCVSIDGQTPEEERGALYDRWRAGEARILVSKPSIFGFGLNMQFCADMAFVGLSDSWEAFYQAIRRCWRYRQEREVAVHTILSAAEGATLANIRRKEADAETMRAETVGLMRDAMIANLRAAPIPDEDYRPTKPLRLPPWLSPAFPELPAERWRPVPDYEGLYEVSDRGAVRRIVVAANGAPPGPLSASDVGGGFLQVKLRKGGRERAFSLARLVASAFVRPLARADLVLPRDGDRANVALDNLEVRQR